MPQVEQPLRFIAVLERFLDETEPASFDREEWRGAASRPPDQASPRRARQDSNLWPPPPEGGALSS